MNSNPSNPERPSIWKSMLDRIAGGAEKEAIRPVDEPLDLEGLDLELLHEIESREKPPRPAEEDLSFDAPDDLSFEEEAATPETEGAEADADQEEDEFAGEAAPAVAKDDSYWSALEGLSFEEEGEPKAVGGRGGRPSRGRASGRERGSRPAAERPAPRKAGAEEFVADDEFGAGLDAEHSPPRPAASDRTAAAEPGFEKAPRRPSRRERGRGRGRDGDDRRSRQGPPQQERTARGERPAKGDRSRRGERSPAQESAEFDEVPIEDSLLFPEPASAESSAGASPLDALTGSDEFGAGLEETPSRLQRPARRPEPSRSRAPSEPREQPAPALTEDVAFEADLEEDELPVADIEDEAGDDEQAGLSRADRYRNVPTWEQAISYLVQPRRPSGGSSRGGDRSRQSRGGGRGSGSRRGGDGDGRSGRSRSRE